MADSANRIDIAEIIKKIDYDSVPDAVVQVFQTTSLGELDAAIGNSFYGINHRQQPAAVPINKDTFGLTFFTRPKFNLATENLNLARQLTALLTTKEESVQRAIRNTLDRELVKHGIRCPFVDNQQAFIPLLSNHLVSMSGWPDVKADTYVAPDGAYKQTWGMVDGVAQDYSAYDITADFRNMPGSPITLLFFTWIHYMSLIYQGILVPHYENIIENEIDYQTRIYRLTMDASKTVVTGIAACGAALPVSAPMGAMFNFSTEKPYNDAHDTMSINFRCFGALYMYDMLIYEFNRTVQLFNDTMKNRYRESMYRRVDAEFLEIFNNRGYPRINPNTYELEWWVPKDIYNQKLSIYTSQKKRRTA